MFTYFLLWFPIVLLAILNGAIREFAYKKSLGDLRAHQVSTATLLILITVYSWFVFDHWEIESSNKAIVIGIIWLLMTEAFEFLAGHYLFKNSWEKILHDYNILKGRIWILIPLWTLIVPTIIYKLRQ